MEGGLAVENERLLESACVSAKLELHDLRRPAVLAAGAVQARHGPNWKPPPGAGLPGLEPGAGAALVLLGSARSVSR